jgi:hypothetical protein
MSNDACQYELYLSIEGDVDDSELDQQQIYLRNELKELNGIGDVNQIKIGKLPPGARAVELVAIGALAVTFKQAGVFDAIVSVIKSWIEHGNRRKEKRKVVVKRPDGTMLEFDGYSLKDIEGFEGAPGVDCS